jgi:hypothetical protein
MHRKWFLAPVITVDGSPQLANGRNQQVAISGMNVHIGHSPENTTECLVSIPTEMSPAQGWTPVSEGDVVGEFERLFGRAPTTSEITSWCLDAF